MDYRDEIFRALDAGEIDEEGARALYDKYVTKSVTPVTPAPAPPSAAVATTAPSGWQKGALAGIAASPLGSMVDAAKFGASLAPAVTGSIALGKKAAALAPTAKMSDVGEFGGAAIRGLSPGFDQWVGNKEEAAARVASDLGMNALAEKFAARADMNKALAAQKIDESGDPQSIENATDFTDLARFAGSQAGLQGANTAQGMALGLLTRGRGLGTATAAQAVPTFVDEYGQVAGTAREKLGLGGGSESDVLGGALKATAAEQLGMMPELMAVRKMGGGAVAGALKRAGTVAVDPLLEAATEAAQTKYEQQGLTGTEFYPTPEELQKQQEQAAQAALFSSGVSTVPSAVAGQIADQIAAPDPTERLRAIVEVERQYGDEIASGKLPPPSSMTQPQLMELLAQKKQQGENAYNIAKEQIADQQKGQEFDPIAVPTAEQIDLARSSGVENPEQYTNLRDLTDALKATQQQATTGRASDMEQILSAREGVSPSGQEAQVLGGNAGAGQVTANTAPAVPPVERAASPQVPQPAAVAPPVETPQPPSAPVLSAEQVKRNFPAAEVADNGDGSFTASFPEYNALRVHIKPTGEITLGPGGEQSLQQHGKQVGDGRRITGSVTLRDNEAVMKLVDTGEMPHEALHVAMEYFATPQEQLHLREAFGDNQEDMANDYRAWFDGRESAHASLWQKVKDFFARLAQTVGIQNKSGIYQSIASGKMMQREATGGERAVRTQLPMGEPALERAALSESEAAQRATEGGPKYAQNEANDAGRVNLETFPPEMRDFVQNITENVEMPGLTKALQTRPNDEVIAKAKEILSNDARFKSLISRDVSAAVKDEQLTALAMLYADSITRVKDASDAYQENNTEENKAKYLLAHVEANAVYSKLIGARAEAGRALASIKMAKAAIRQRGGAPAIMQALADRGISLSDEEMAQLSALPPGDMRAFLDFQKEAIRAREKHSWKDYITAYRMFNMLFNTSTQSANVVSNGIKTILDVVPDAIEALLSKDKKLADVFTYYMAYLKAQPAAFLSAGQTMTKGVSDLQLKRGLYSGVAGEAAAAEFKGGALNPINMSTRVTRAGDALFADAHYIAATEMLAARDGRKKGLTGQALADFIEDQKLSGKYHAAALEMAKEKTFQEGSKALSAVMKTLNQPSLSWLRWVLPFVKTPWNINAAAMRMIPGAGLVASKMQGKTNARAVAEQSLGLALTMAGVAFAAAGRATAGAPEGAGEKDKFFNAEKKETYSVKIGDRWVKYSRLGPLAMPIIAGIAINEYRKRGGEDKDAGAAIGKMLGNIGKMVSDQSMLQGLNGLSKAMAEPDKYFESFLKGIAGQMVPAASLQRQVTRGTENEVLETGDFVDKLLADLPKVERNAVLKLIGRTEIPQKYDALGRPQEYRGGGWQALLGWIKKSEDVTDPVVKELLDLKVPYPNVIGDKIQQEITEEQRAAKEANLGRDLLKSEMKQSAPIERDQLSEKRKTVGGAVYDAVKRTMENKAYQRMSAVNRAATLERVIRGVKTRASKNWNRTEMGR